MQHNKSDLFILRPTKAFLSFIESQLPDSSFIDIALLPTNHTAYTIDKQDSDEATLDEIERHFPLILQHEIGRVLGPNGYHGIVGSFLDFLCCFKFEMHSHIVVMEPSLSEGHQLLCVKPRSVLLTRTAPNHIAPSGDSVQVLDRVSVSSMTENSTVIVKNFNQLSSVAPFIKDYYRPIMKAEMRRMCTKSDQWPEIDSFQMFRRYFAVEIHTQLIHLDVD